MESRNCPNCGAPNDPYLNKCPYCGTSYFDLTSIDIADGKPMFLKIRVQDVIITQLVRPDPNVTIEFTKEKQDCTNAQGILIQHWTKSVSCTTDIKFHAIPNEKNTLCTVTKEI